MPILNLSYEKPSPSGRDEDVRLPFRDAYGLPEKERLECLICSAEINGNSKHGVCSICRKRLLRQQKAAHKKQASPL